MQLSKAENELIGMIRSGDPFAVMLMRKEAKGEMAVSTSVPPFVEADTMIAIEMTFDEGWRERRRASEIAERVR